MYYVLFKSCFADKSATKVKESLRVEALTRPKEANRDLRDQSNPWPCQPSMLVTAVVVVLVALISPVYLLIFIIIEISENYCFMIM